jgi:hypothetical protein
VATYKPLQSITLTSNASSVTFSGIPQDYTDLVLVSQTQQVTSGEDLAIRFNNDSTSIYSRTYICGDGSTAHSGRSTSQTYVILDHHGTPPTSTSFGSSIVNIPNYSNTTLNKTVLNRNGSIDSSPAVATVSNVGLWRSTSAITSITVLCTNSSNLKAGSTFDLYGIKSGAPQALGGDTVTTDGNYWYHTFRSTQTFTPLRPLTVDYLVVAGGGGSGDNGGGGGGGGGLRSTVTATGGGGSVESPLALNSQAYTVTVGAGGNAGVGGSNPTSGTNSSLATITSTGGGYGGGYTGFAQAGGAGGSGGGGNGNGNTAGGAASPAGQGYAGGAGVPAPAGYYRTSGGGGGAGAVGTAGTGNSKTGGNGGNGIFTALSNAVNAGQLSGGNYYLSGGGGGVGETAAGTSGLGGAGTPSINSTGGNGTANTGGGAGGAGGTGGNGGSGIVIVRYAV